MNHLIPIAMLLIVTLSAQQPAQPVQIEAADGLTLQADYYPPPQSSAPAVLLLHQLYTNRTSWQPLAQALQARGYAVLVPDLRGYGQTRGKIDWQEAQQDTYLWMDWLIAHEETADSHIGIVGSSMGANLAVIGCAETACAAAVALSPGLNYFGYTPLIPSLESDLINRPVLMISSERDGYPARAVRQFQTDYAYIDVMWLPGNAHGIDLLDDTTTAQLIGWLDASLR